MIKVEVLEDIIDAIGEAKRELLAMDPSPSVRRDLDQAYAALANAERSLAKLIGNEPRIDGARP